VTRKKVFGKCHICGQEGKLSYEHVPPEKAFNNYRTKIYKGIQLIEKDDISMPWDFRSLKGDVLQRGIGNYTLCINCNNNTGAWYGSSYIDFVFQSFKILKNSKRVSETEESNFFRVYPLRIIKQIISMFFSINSPEFAVVHKDLVEFVLNKTKKYLDNNKYGLYIYYLSGEIFRYAGLCSILKIDKHLIRVVSELATMPLGFVLELNPKPEFKTAYNVCDILSFANLYDYDEKKDIRLEIPLLESNIHLPLDYRTKEQIFKDRLISELRNLLKKKK
jgi:hypothetical protein